MMHHEQTPEEEVPHMASFQVEAGRILLVVVEAEDHLVIMVAQEMENGYLVGRILEGDASTVHLVEGEVVVMVGNGDHIEGIEDLIVEVGAEADSFFGAYFAFGSLDLLEMDVVVGR